MGTSSGNRRRRKINVGGDGARPRFVFLSPTTTQTFLLYRYRRADSSRSPVLITFLQLLSLILLSVSLQSAPGTVIGLCIPMSVMRRLRPAFLYLVIVFFGTAQGLTYTFSFKETNLDNFLQAYYLNVEVDISFSDDGSATFTTTVLNVTPLHFSMFVNGRKYVFD